MLMSVVAVHRSTRMSARKSAQHASLQPKNGAADILHISHGMLVMAYWLHITYGFAARHWGTRHWDTDADVRSGVWHASLALP